MTLNELVEVALSDPYSLIGEGKFYNVDFDIDEITLQGTHSGDLMRMLPQHVTDKLECKNQMHFVAVVTSTTRIPNDPDLKCFQVRVTLTN